MRGFRVCVCVCEGARKNKGFIRTGACVRGWIERYAFGAILYHQAFLKIQFFFSTLNNITSPIGSLEFCAKANFPNSLTDSWPNGLTNSNRSSD